MPDPFFWPDYETMIPARCPSCGSVAQHFSFSPPGPIINVGTRFFGWCRSEHSWSIAAPEVAEDDDE